MTVSLGGWEFAVDREATLAHTRENALDHCLCPYCRNYYDTLLTVYPELEAFFSFFGVDYMGPSELMPFAPTLLLACYRVQGKILQWGNAPLMAGEISISPEYADEHSFFLWVGEAELPWVQTEAMEDVVSPANLPEFLERMEEVWLLRHGESMIFS